MEENKSSPLVSVVLPIYKGEKYLEEAIQSILDQTYIHFELILVNDASPDNSKAVIESFNDKRIIYVQNEVNIGLIGSLNKGISIAKGKYIARMDQDDICVLDRFEKQVAYLEENSDIVICGMQGKIINSKKKMDVPLEDLEIRALLFFGSPFIHPVVMMRKTILDDHCLKYDRKYEHAEDFGLWINLSFAGKMANLPDYGIHYRKHEGQYTEVFLEGNRLASFFAKLEYLERLNIYFKNSEFVTYKKILQRNIDLKDINEMYLVSEFLKRLYKKCRFLNIDHIFLKEIIYRKWKILCGERQKTDLPTYGLFLKGPFVFSIFELKVHLWFVKRLVWF